MGVCEGRAGELVTWAASAPHAAPFPVPKRESGTRSREGPRKTPDPAPLRANPLHVGQPRGETRDRSAQRLPGAPLMSLPWRRLMAVQALGGGRARSRRPAIGAGSPIRTNGFSAIGRVDSSGHRAGASPARRLHASSRKRTQRPHESCTKRHGQHRDCGPPLQPPRRASFICSTRSSTLVSARRWASALCWLCLPVLVA